MLKLYAYLEKRRNKTKQNTSSAEPKILDKKKTNIAQEIKFSVILIIITLVIFGIGAGAGFYWAIKDFRNKINQHSKAETLGRLLTIDKSRDRTAMSRSYFDSAKIVAQIDSFSWDVPTVITPFVGYAPQPGLHGNAHINSMQFRSNQELIMPKPANTYRIFITGGSTAFSSGAPSQERTISGYLAQILNEKLFPATQLNYEVFTMASPAWSSTHERIIIENRLSELEPDLVISFSGNNDVHWGRLGRNIFWFRSYNDDYYWDLLNTLYNTAGFDGMPDVIEIQEDRINPADVAKRLEKNVKLASYTLFQKKIPYLFILQPTLALTKKELNEYEAQQVKQDQKQYFLDCYTEIDKLLSQVTKGNFTFFNFADIFDNQGSDNQLFLDRYHFGDKGNKIIAEQIFRKTKDILSTKTLALEDK